MSSYATAYARPVAALDVDTRATFITRTYAHLLGAIVAFTVLQVVMFRTGFAFELAGTLLRGGPLLMFGGFMLVSWVASRAAFSARSLAIQYVALLGFIAAEAIFFTPLLVYAFIKAPGAIESAAVVSLGGFAGLTMVAFVTRKDFSFLRGILAWGGVCAIGLIVASLVFGFQLGTWFSVGMVAFAGSAILYDTSNVLHHFPEDRYVAASLQLFASVALLFWYVLRLFIASRD